MTKRLLTPVRCTRPHMSPLRGFGICGWLETLGLHRFTPKANTCHRSAIVIVARPLTVNTYQRSAILGLRSAETLGFHPRLTYICHRSAIVIVAHPLSRQHVSTHHDFGSAIGCNLGFTPKANICHRSAIVIDAHPLSRHHVSTFRDFGSAIG